MLRSVALVLAAYPATSSLTRVRDPRQQYIIPCLLLRYVLGKDFVFLITDPLGIRSER